MDSFSMKNKPFAPSFFVPDRDHQSAYANGKTK